MITSPRTLMRNAADARIYAQVLEWLNDQPRHRWHTLTEAAPHLPLDVDQLLRLWNQWIEEGWVEQRTEGDHVLWRPTEKLPIVSKREREERLSWSDYFSALLELPDR